MPNYIKKKGEGCYEVFSLVKDNKTGKEVRNLHSKCTTEGKAKKQKQILDMYNRKTAIFDKYGEAETMKYKEKMKKKYPAKKSNKKK